MVVNFTGFFNKYVEKLYDNLITVSPKIIEDVINIFDSGTTVFLIGNGGSMATASHFAEDLLYVSKRNDVLVLDSLPAITALSNDYGYEDVFVNQLIKLSKVGDILIAFSASGNSENILRAVDYMNYIGKTIGFVGFDGGKLKDRCYKCIHIDTDYGEYGLVEDIHLIICHIITFYLKERNKL